MTVHDCHTDILCSCKDFDKSYRMVDIFIESAYRDLKIHECETELSVIKESTSQTDANERMEDVYGIFIEKSIASRKYAAKSLSNFFSGVTLKIRKLLTDVNYKMNIKRLRDVITKDPSVGKRKVSIPDYTKSKQIMDNEITQLENYIDKVKSESRIDQTELSIEMSDCKNSVKKSKKERMEVDITLSELLKFFEGNMALSSITQYGKSKEEAYRNILKDVGPNQAKQMEAEVHKGITKLINLYGKMIQVRTYFEWEEASGTYAALKQGISFKSKMDDKKRQKEQDAMKQREEAIGI